MFNTTPTNLADQSASINITPPNHRRLIHITPSKQLLLQLKHSLQWQTLQHPRQPPWAFTSPSASPLTQMVLSIAIPSSPARPPPMKPPPLTPPWPSPKTSLSTQPPTPLSASTALVYFLQTLSFRSSCTFMGVGSSSSACLPFLSMNLAAPWRPRLQLWWRPSSTVFRRSTGFRRPTMTPWMPSCGFGARRSTAGSRG